MRPTLTIRDIRDDSLAVPEDLYFDFPTIERGLILDSIPAPVSGNMEPGVLLYAIGVVQVRHVGPFPELIAGFNDYTPALGRAWLKEARDVMPTRTTFTYEQYEIEITHGRNGPTARELANTYGWEDLLSRFPIINPGEGEANHIVGTDQRNRIPGTADDDSIEGFAGPDRILARGGDDFVFGGGGNDRLFGGDGKDTLLGDRGDDTLTGGKGVDVLGGRVGHDTMFGEGGVDYIFGQRGNDEIFGGDGNDVLDGDKGNDTIEGGRGDDSINGGFGIDVLMGGSGNDTFHDSFGNDTYTGGGGEDLFMFSFRTQTELITDFDLGKDRIDISSLNLRSLDMDYEFVPSSETRITAARINFDSGHYIQIDLQTNGTIAELDAGLIL